MAARIDGSQLVDVSNPASLARWASTLGCNPAELLRAVDQIGREVADILEYLRGWQAVPLARAVHSKAASGRPSSGFIEFKPAQLQAELIPPAERPLVAAVGVRQKPEVRAPDGSQDP